MGHGTPGLDVEGDNRLGGRLGLGLLLLAVLGQALLADAGRLGVFFLVAAEQIDVVIVGGVGAVDGVGLGGVARQGAELVLERRNVLVPAGGVGIIVSVGAGLEGFEAGDIGLRGGMAGTVAGHVSGEAWIRSFRGRTRARLTR